LKSARFLQPFFNLEVKTCPKSLLSIMHLLPLYIARHGDASRDVDVAIKELSGNRTSRENQMLTELTALNRVPHPNILENFGFAFQPEPQPRAFLVFPFMAGGTLTRQLNVEAPDAGWRLRVAFGVASALTVLHAHGIVHRDVKSRNILIDAEGSPKLGDGGEARQMHDDQTHATTRVIGTAPYLDPAYGDMEQLREASDVFSLGVVMLELLTGRPAYRTGMTPSVILWRCFRAGTPDERLENAVACIDWGAWNGAWGYRAVAELATRCTSEAHEHRPTAAALTDALQQIIQPAEPGATEQRAAVAGAAARQCLVCLDAPRAVRFGCGHLVACSDCAQILHARGDPCPLCRGVLDAAWFVDVVPGANEATNMVMDAPPPPMTPPHVGGAAASVNDDDANVLRVWRDGCPVLRALWPAGVDVRTWEGVKFGGRSTERRRGGWWRLT
jgi:hypothetical protein